MNIEEILDNFNDEKTACTFSPEDVQKNSVQAILPYIFPVLFFLPLIADKEKKSAFCKFHANQQFTWFIVSIIFQTVKMIIRIIPIISIPINIALDFMWLAVALGLMYGASKGKALRLPYVGEMINLF